MKRRWPIVRDANVAIGHEHGRERQGIRDDEQPHSELFMADGKRSTAPLPCRFGRGRMCFRHQLPPEHEKPEDVDP